jgi:PKD repeat protein
MRKIVTSLLAMVLVALVLLSGCEKEDLKPYITRLVTSGNCGVAPHDVEFLAIVSSGIETSDPTGANMWHTMTWDLGDGTQASGSKVYHTYAQPGTYVVEVVARDEDGDEARAATTIAVTADTLLIEPAPTLDGDPIASGATVIAGRDVLSLAINAETCGLDSDVDSEYSRFIIEWLPPNGSPVFGQNTDFVFAVTLTDTQWIHLTVRDPGLAVSRRDSIFFVMETPPERILSLAVDMSGVEEIDMENGVHVAGTFNDWDPAATVMSDPDSNRIFDARIEVEPDSEVRFRFVNGNTADGLERVPPSCSIVDDEAGRVRQLGIASDDVQFLSDFSGCPEEK